MSRDARVFGLALLCFMAVEADAATPHLVFGINAGQTCDVYQDANRIEESLGSSTSGSLIFSATGGGAFHIVTTGSYVDTIPPAAITSLATSTITSSSIRLTFTSVGDDGNSGSAASYDLRFSTSPITDANWASATQFVGESLPKPPGQAEAITVTGLAASTTYHFAIKAGDEMPNWGALSNVVSGTTSAGAGDTTPPGTVSNLALANPTASSLTLNWTATGDDGGTGTATTYDVRYGTGPITAANWNQAPQASGEPAPKAAGQSESFTLTGLQSGTTYYVALKVADEVPNWGGMSNVPSGATSGGGGGTDTTPPGAVTNLAVSGTTSSSATLQWTATGDDGTVGTATTYDIRYGTTPLSSANWNQATQVSGEPAPKPSGQAESFAVTGLQAGTTYYFAMKVADEVPNLSGGSNVPSGTTTSNGDQTPPAAVGNLAVVTSTTSSITLTWTATGDDGTVGTASSYDVRYLTTPLSGSNWNGASKATGEPVPKPSGQTETFTVSGLSSGTTYYFGLKVADEVPNASTISNVPTGATQALIDTTPPAGVSNLTIATTNATSLVLTWTATGDDGTLGRASAYDLRYSTTSITSSNFNQAPQVSGEPPPKASGQPEAMTIVGLQPSTRYYFALKVRDEAANWSPMSNVPTVVTDPTSDAQAPAAVSDLAAYERLATRIRIGWTATGDDGLIGTAHHYDVRRSLSPITTTNWNAATPVGPAPIPGPSGSFSDLWAEGLSNATRYYFALKVFDEAGNVSPVSNVINAVTLALPDTLPPRRIGDLTAERIGHDSLTVRWLAPEDSTRDGVGAFAYQLRLHTVPIAEDGEGFLEFTGPVEPAAPGATEHFVFAALLPRTQYFVRLRARDSDGNWSRLSNELTVLTADEPPAPGDSSPPGGITDLNATDAGAEWVALRWTAPGDDGQVGHAASYDLRRATFPITTATWELTTALTGEPAPAPAGGTETLTVSGLSAGTLYYFALRTRDEVGNESITSNVAQRSTVLPTDDVGPSAVADLAVSDSTYTTLTFAWTAPADSVPPHAVGEEQVESYEIRYRLGSPITENDWPTATSVTPPSPTAPRANQQLLLSGLQSGTLYYLALKSIDQSGNRSALSNAAPGVTRKIVIDDPPPPPPVEGDSLAPGMVVNLVFAADSPHAGTLRWTATGDDGVTGTAAAYRLRHVSGPDAAALDAETPDWALADSLSIPLHPSVAGLAEGHSIGSLESGRAYRFGLRALDEAGNLGDVAWTLAVSTPWPADDLPPDAVVDLTALLVELSKPEGHAVSSTGAVMLRWTAPSDPRPERDPAPVSEYWVRRLDAAGTPDWNAADWDTLLVAPSAPGLPESLRVVGLERDRSYAFSVLARDAAENVGALSNVATVLVPADTTDDDPDDPPPPPPADSIAPGAIASLEGYALGPFAVRLNWLATGDDVASGRATRYQLRWSLSAITESNWAGLDTIPGLPNPAEPASVESFDWTGLASNTTYFVSARAFDEAGNLSVLGNVAEVQTPEEQDLSPPSVPNGLRLSWSGTLAQAVWDPCPDPDFESFTIYRRLSTELEVVEIASSLDEPRWDDSAVLAGMTYVYAVAARDQNGNLSGRSGEVELQIPLPPPPPDGGTAPEVTVDLLVVDPINVRLDEVSLRWSTRAGDDLVGFRVYRERRPNETDLGTRVLLTSELLLGPGPHRFRETPLPEPGSYRYWIEAVSVSNGVLLLDPLLVAIPELSSGLVGVFPNPTQGQVRVVWVLEEAASFEARLYDLAGRTVGSAFLEHGQAGRNEWRFDLGQGVFGSPPAGVYYMNLRSGSRRETIRLILAQSRAGR